MSSKSARVWLAILGFIGVVVLSASFAINPSPPAGASLAQITAWGQAHETLIEAGAWLQVIGSFLQMAFVLGLLSVTKTINRYIGILTASAVVLIMGVSLVESSFYLNAVAGGVSGDLATLGVSLNLIKSIQHAYAMIPAPALDAGLGAVVLTSELFANWFGRVLGILGLLFGVALLVLGFFGTFTPLQVAIDNVLMAQQVWLIGVTIAIAIARPRATSQQPQSSAGAVLVAE